MRQENLQCFILCHNISSGILSAIQVKAKRYSKIISCFLSASGMAFAAWGLGGGHLDPRSLRLDQCLLSPTLLDAGNFSIHTQQQQNNSPKPTALPLPCPHFCNAKLHGRITNIILHRSPSQLLTHGCQSSQLFLFLTPSLCSCG